MRQPENRGDQSLPVSKYLQIDKVCRRFEAAWKQGDQLRIEDYLGGCAEPERSQLRRELLAIQAEYRKRVKDRPTLAVFIERLIHCGLMTRQACDAVLAGMTPESMTVEDLARELYRQGKLTKFQAQAVYQGKTHGLVVGNYVVLDRLGKGGMGHVYKAQHRKMERVVALKVLPSSATRSEEAVRRFQREAKAAARLSHPNIVTAHDADEFHGIYFLVMEYVAGKDLAAVVKERGPLSVCRAVDCILQAARGLQYAHSQGVVHRDIKPHNLLLDSKGTVKVLDMGLARVEEHLVNAEIDAETARADPAADAGLTSIGQVLGTLDYMPPEQALDTKLADQRADIYSLGCTLHYLLIGRPPYGGSTVREKILAHGKDPIPALGALRNDVPAPLEAIFHKMLAKRPEERQQTMAEVIAALERCIAEEKLSLDKAALADTQNFRADVDLDTSIAHTAGMALDGSLINRAVEVTQRLMAPTVASVARGLSNIVSSKRGKIVLGAATGLLLLVLFGVIVLLRTSRGTLVVEVDEPKAKAEPVTEVGKAVAALPGGGEKAVPRSGKLVVSVDQPGAIIQISDEQGEVHSTHLSGDKVMTLSLPAGRYQLYIEKAGFKPFTADFAVNEGKEERTMAALEKESVVLPKENVTTGSATNVLDPTEKQSVIPPQSPQAAPQLAVPTTVDQPAAPAGGVMNDENVQPAPIDAPADASSKLLPPSRTLSLEDCRSYGPFGYGGLVFSHNGKLLACVVGNCIVIWDTATGNRVKNLPVMDSVSAGRIVFSPNDDLLFAWRPTLGGKTSRLSVPVSLVQWDLARDKSESLNLPVENIRALALSANGRLAAAAAPNRKIYLWDLQAGTAPRTLATKLTADDMALSVDGALLALVNHARSGENRKPGSVTVWDLKKKQELWSKTTSSQRSVLLFSPDGEILLAPDERTAGVFVDSKTGKEKFGTIDTKIRRSRVTYYRVALLANELVAFSPNGMIFASAGRSKDVTLAGIDAGRTLLGLGTGDTLVALAFSPDGRILAALCRGYVRLWDVSTILSTPSSGNEPAASEK